MFCVFWCSKSGGEMIPSNKIFGKDEMCLALTYMEELRRTAEIHFVTMSSENPDSVGKPGVDVVGVGYGWTKRRNNMPGYKK